MAATGSVKFSSLFISHGAPTLPISKLPARAFLERLGRELAKPAAIVVVSPHWMTKERAVKSPPRFSTWHDFYGFPEALNALEYDAPGDGVLRERVRELLGGAGVAAAASDDLRLDHGAWVPLLLMFPDVDVPVVQVSATWDTPRDYHALGRALAPLAADGVLLLGSGGLVHNLREIEFDSDTVPDWARQFADWTDARLNEGDWEALFDYRKHAPDAARAHPTEDHWLPLFFAGGAGGAATRLHASFAHGGLSMACYGFR
ncbi:MAG: DODA-type extradiol aromatic ring-opening family dioxygenase [Nevskiaceae bacterium]